MPQSSTLAAELAAIRDLIKPHTETPGLDAQVLLAHICQQDRSWLLAHPEFQLSTEETTKLEHSLSQLESGTPLPYVLGEWEFFGRKFQVTPDVLIPRPETELLVETALAWLRENPDRQSAAEAGAGSGCISVSLAASIPYVKVIATEISPQAAKVARANVTRFDLQDQVTILEDDLLTNLPGPFDLIVANLPYIPTKTLHQLPIFEREPTLALDGGPDGLDLVERLLIQAADRITAGGLILLEIESGQGRSASAIAARYFPPAGIQVKSDLAGHPRLLVVQT